VRPGSLEQAVEQLRTGEKAQVHAGGTDLLSCLRDYVFSLDKVVSLSGIEGLSSIEKTGEGGLRIGALTTITQVATSDAVMAGYPGLAQAAGEVASPQLRNQGTLGGNLCQKPRCWYYRGEFHCLRKGGPRCFAVAGENAFHCILGGAGCFIVHPSDTAPALAALGASLRIAGPQGNRTMQLEGFHVPPSQNPLRETVLEPGEILTHIVLPPPPKGLYSAYRKVRARRSWDFALAGVALALVMDGGAVAEANIFLSGAAPIPWRAKEAEEAITGKPIDAKTAAAAGRAAMERARPMTQNEYKVSLFEGVIEEELLKAAASAA
jgi:xanthine dehydrogenase YagS FAD-binding subunit